MDALVVASTSAPRQVTSALPTRLTACWRLAWTSERGTLFLLEKFPGGWGGEYGNEMRSTKAYTRVDVAVQSLSHAVVFANGNEFIVDSVIQVDSPTRVDCRRASATLALKRPFAFTFTLQLPPAGAGTGAGGYFDNVYVDETLRIARDSRGDTLVAVRDESLEARGLS